MDTPSLRRHLVTSEQPFGLFRNEGSVAIASRASAEPRRRSPWLCQVRHNATASSKATLVFNVPPLWVVSSGAAAYVLTDAATNGWNFRSQLPTTTATLRLPCPLGKLATNPAQHRRSA